MNLIGAFDDLTVWEGIFSIVAYGGSVLVIIACAYLVGPDLWREGLTWTREQLDHPPTRPQWMEQELEDVRREQLNAAAIVPFKRRRS